MKLRGWGGPRGELGGGRRVQGGEEGSPIPAPTVQFRAHLGTLYLRRPPGGAVLGEGRRGVGPGLDLLQYGSFRK